MSIEAYTVWEMRRFIMIGLSDFTPQALQQLIESELGTASPQFKLLIIDLLLSYCSRFYNHASRWMVNSKEDPIQTLKNWHMQWEGFHADEPWHNSKDQPISYFMNINYGARLDEMYSQFIVDH